MRKRSMVRQLPLSLFFIAIAGLGVYVWYSTERMKDSVIEHMREELEARSFLVSSQFSLSGLDTSVSQMQARVQMLGEGTRSRVTIIDTIGFVIGDSQEEPAKMENHAHRPEIAGALRGNTSWAMRYSATLGLNMLYVAEPIRVGGKILGVARVSMKLAAIDAYASEMQMRVLIGGIVIMLVSALLIYVSMRKIAAPIAALREGAEQFARGNFGHRLPIGETDEIAALVDSMSEMARQLDERISTILKQRNEQEAVLSSMIESVIAVDLDERILNMNHAAARLFDVNAVEAEGKNIQEVLRNIDVQRFAARTLSATRNTEAIITLHEGEDKHLQAHGSVLRDGNGKAIGAVIVAHDITPLRRLEAIRRDFVANVSHELKTPVTSIKGFVETLQDGAFEDEETRDRFLAIIAKESDRLHNIIEDLLSLSRLEQESERLDITMETLKLHDVLAAAMEACDALAREKKSRMSLFCDESIQAHINGHLIEQAVCNLIDNALKYSDENSEVTIHADHDAASTVIRVVDRGRGIPADHIGRIFERFYRVDKGRSRKSGSTGLGLAIVKHIVQAHSGHVFVESAAGRGSTFTIVLPVSQ